MMLWGMHEVCSSTRRGLKQTFQRPQMESYDEWLVSGVHQYTEVGNIGSRVNFGILEPA